MPRRKPSNDTPGTGRPCGAVKPKRKVGEWKELHRGWENFLAEMEGRPLPHPNVIGGAYQLDERGTVIIAKTTDEWRDPDDLIGLDFFDEIAPTPEIKAFRHEFAEFLDRAADGMLNKHFPLPRDGRVLIFCLDDGLIIASVRSGGAQ